MRKSSSKSEFELRVESKYNFGEVVPELNIRYQFWSYGEFELVGHGKQTNFECGRFKKFMGCLKVDLHNQVRWFFPDLKKNSVFQYFRILRVFGPKGEDYFILDCRHYACREILTGMVW